MTADDTLAAAQRVRRRIVLRRIAAAGGQCGSCSNGLTVGLIEELERDGTITRPEPWTVALTDLGRTEAT